MKLYLAGPMTGIPEWNFPAFHEAAEKLRAAGYEVVSPAEIDLEHGFDPKADVSLFTAADRVTALRRDIRAVLEVDGVALLDGWEQSAGARLEAHVATALEIIVAPLDSFLHMRRLLRAANRARKAALV